MGVRSNRIDGLSYFSIDDIILGGSHLHAEHVARQRLLLLVPRLLVVDCVFRLTNYYGYCVYL